MAGKLARKLKTRRLNKLKIQKQNQVVVSDFEKDDDDNILDYDSFCKECHIQLLHHLNTWKYDISESILFYRIETIDCPKIIVSINIDKNLKVEVFTYQTRVKSEYVNQFLNSSNILESWTQMKSILEHYESLDENIQTNFKYNLSQAFYYLQNCLLISTSEPYFTVLVDKLRFLIGQLYAMRYNEYTTDLIALAQAVYLQSSTSYKILYKMNYLILPPAKYLIKCLSDKESENDYIQYHSQSESETKNWLSD